ncbi:MAG: hypothetical protein CMJ84_17100 [Planctomycetes bacterium]|nr:hypothetical protein [Planctomycetota bacterium]MDP6408844.1 hypothetical protein [Planctomycetota bacterium]
MSPRRRSARGAAGSPDAPSAAGATLAEAVAREAPERPEAWPPAALVLFALSLAHLGPCPGGVGATGELTGERVRHLGAD